MGLILSVLALQTAMPILIRCSRRSRTGKGSTTATSQYNPASITLLAEIIKCMLAFGLIYRAAVLRKQQSGADGARQPLLDANDRFVSSILRLRWVPLDLSNG